GNKEINSKKILTTWHKEGKIISQEKTVGMEGWVEFEEYYLKQINNDKSKWDVNFTIINIDIFKSCAIVKVEVSYRLNERKYGEMQFLNLLKDKKGWLIYSKIFEFY
ncbi:MAG: hypothetical protein ACTSO7_06295, partial [Candidatus Heimdallarchaeota archaeon]